MILTNISLLPLMGTTHEWRESTRVALSMAAVVIVYQIVSYLVIPEYSHNWFEVFGTWAGLTCVWLARTENILTWPWGIVSAALLGYFFATIGLPGQQWLNWGYFVIIQFWAWPQWAFGGERSSALPVSALSGRERGAVIVAAVLGTAAVYWLIDLIVPGSLFPILDAVVVASSIVAQYLLGRKKIESWVLWLGPVNLISIILFGIAGAYTVMALYVAFFIHAFWAWRTWRQVAAITTSHHV